MCVVCDHPQREAIDRAIVAGDSVRKIGTMFGTSKSEVQRHKAICMKRVLAASLPVQAVPVYQTPSEAAIAQQNVRSVTARAGELVSKMEGLVCRFEATGNTEGLLKAAKEVREGLRLLAQLSGELQTGGTRVEIDNRSIVASDSWIQTRSRIVQALVPYPDARAAVIAALRDQLEPSTESIKRGQIAQNRNSAQSCVMGSDYQTEPDSKTRNKKDISEVE
ncbi:MAG: hypothetical protein A4E35_00558 [Methanoregula sp. PtaU1.Bin051]|nr:MAG: hypothetical protein A4E35_00558 [Methanoregula sp. PtaU1.Bin051]